MAQIIIGVHGLRNKPPKRVLKKWWKLSIKEGLRAFGHPTPYFKFELVYWADLVHEKPKDPKVNDKNHPLYLKEPYTLRDEIPMKQNSKLRVKVLHYLEKQMEKIFFNDDMSLNFSSITDLILRHFFKDLDIYYSKRCLDRNNVERPAKDILREELATVLKKYKKKKIMLVGHSMGSIIAYDVLTHVLPDIKIDTFITLGSPLGFPVIISKTMTEMKEKKNDQKYVTTPENVKKCWHNYSDLHDNITMNFDLSDDYKSNSKNIGVIDHIVVNDYKSNEESNPHKIYGYLRTKEFAKVVYDFINSDRPKFIIKIVDKINLFIDSVLKRNSQNHTTDSNY